MARKKTGTAKDDDRSDELADAEKRALFYWHKKKFKAATAEAKAASMALTAVKERATAELGPTAVDDMKDSIKWDKKGGEAMIQAAFERLARLARWAGFEIGTQTELFRDAPKNQTPYDRGYLVALDGGEASSPYDPGSSQAQEWMTGFHEGTAKMNAIMRTKDAEEFDEAEEGDADGAGEGGDTADDADQLPGEIGDQAGTAQVHH